jgi:hypothetical protein
VYLVLMPSCRKRDPTHTRVCYTKMSVPVSTRQAVRIGDVEMICSKKSAGAFRTRCCTLLASNFLAEIERGYKVSRNHRRYRRKDHRVHKTKKQLRKVTGEMSGSHRRISNPDDIVEIAPYRRCRFFV